MSGAAPVDHPWWHVYRFIRVSAFGATALLPLLGAASHGAPVRSEQIAGLLGIALSFHIFAYVLNDVIDLPIDRLEPQRQTFPLVRGLLTARQALAIALAQVPVAVVLAGMLGLHAPGIAALGAAFALMSVYNVWGKRCRWPFLTDLAQGLGWAALLLVGAYLPGHTPAALTWALVAFEVVFILLINGAHGSLRDLANDLRCGARTMAIWLGARPGDSQRAVILPVQMSAYALLLHSAALLVLLAAVALGWVHYGPPLRLAVGVGLLGALVWGGWLLWRTGTARDQAALISGGTAHIGLLLAALMLVVAPQTSPALLASMLGVYVLPFVANPGTPRAIRWLWQGHTP